MRRFESIVMSEVEPSAVGTLWMRPKYNTIKDNEDNPVIAGMSILYFGEVGWKPIVDLDTRYNINYTYEYTPSEDSIITNNNNNPEVGLSEITNILYLYDGSRDLENSANIVTEKGLKIKVDALTSEIASIKERLDDIETTISSLISENNTISSAIGNINNQIAQLSDTVSGLINNTPAEA